MANNSLSRADVEQLLVLKRGDVDAVVELLDAGAVAARLVLREAPPVPSFADFARPIGIS